MKITIKNDIVTIKLRGEPEYDMTYKQLADVEKAIEIIRKLQESCHVDSCELTIT